MRIDEIKYIALSNIYSPAVAQVQVSQRATREDSMAGLMGARAFKPDETSIGEAYVKRPRVATRKRKGMMRVENIVNAGLRVS